jgi:hypothetical protein
MKNSKPYKKYQIFEKIKLFLFFTFLLASIFVKSQSPALNTSWEQVWSDEFGGTSLDVTKWKAGVEKGRWQEWFNDQNIEVTGGNLVLSAKKETCPNYCKYDPDGDGPIQPKIKYWSGSEISTNVPGGNHKYGYFEARIKVPYNTSFNNGRGFFPAFWLSVKGQNTGNASWPPELDILEYSSVGNYKAHGTNHLINCNEKNSIADRHYEIYPFEPYNNFYIYGMEWNEHEVKWFIDNQQVGTTCIEEVPHDFFRIVLSLQLLRIPVWATSPLGDLNGLQSKMYVDWVRVHKPIGAQTETDYDKWNRIWHNGDNSIAGKLGEWNLNDDDKHVVGDFDKNGLDEVLSISSNSVFAKLHEYKIDATYGDYWDKLWGNASSSAIGPWNVNDGDQFISGNFDGINGDELLCINSTYVKLLNFNGSSNWSTIWGNGGNSWLGGWNTGVGDTYLVYDFNNDGNDDLICFSENSVYCKVLTYDSGNWITLYGNGSTLGQINPTNNSYWDMNNTDTYKVGDFDGDGYGEILMINDLIGSVKQFEFRPKRGGGYAWYHEWGNGGINGINNVWNLSPGSRYYTYDMGGNSKTELFCISGDNKWEKILNYTGGSTSWHTNWGNAGSYQIWNRDLVGSDKFFFGNFTDKAGFTSAQLFWVKSSWTPVLGSSCSNTHVYLHEMPNSDFNAKFASETSIAQGGNEKINILDSPLSFEVYPNPSNGKFTVKASNKEEFNLIVYNNRGQEVYSFKNLSNKFSFNLSEETTGIYFLKMISQKGVEMKRLIKN